jgi:hypothetical protein
VHSSFNVCVLHALLIPSSLTWSFIFYEEYKLWSSPLCNFSNLLSFHSSSTQIFSSASCSQTPLVCVLPLMSDTKFRAHKYYRQVYNSLYYRFYWRSKIMGASVKLNSSRLTVPPAVGDTDVKTAT